MLVVYLNNFFFLKKAPLFNSQGTDESIEATQSPTAQSLYIT